MVIMGIRQCGKTYITQHFASANYKSVVYINFIKEPERIDAFIGSKAVDSILLNLSAQIEGARFIPGETCFIFDEIQDAMNMEDWETIEDKIKELEKLKCNHP